MFIAVLPPAQVIEHLADQIEHVGPPAGRPRMTTPGSWHITCAFLGEVDDDRADRLADALPDHAAGIEPFPLRLAGIGAFPDLATPRHWWVGVDDPTGRLATLFRACRQACRESGIAVGRAAQLAHLTVARGKPAPDPEWAAAWQGYLGPEWTVDGLDLMVSVLSGTGAHYSSIARFPLGR
ncbi:2'-5' RNA ligase family protein [Brooklawnia cerclae]|nr:RNA 2',3'-cyclic phosphodiesterase [Brooklawnia cerclae]